MKTMMTKGDGKRKTKGGIDTRMSAASYLPLTSARIWPSFATARHHLCQIWAWGKRRSRLFLVAFRELEKRRRAQQPTRADCSAAAATSLVLPSMPRADIAVKLLRCSSVRESLATEDTISRTSPSKTVLSSARRSVARPRPEGRRQRFPGPR